ncbi:amino acid/amide ABC transporter ATP-binding protein 2, HAAT family [Roseomonas rosea]|uniref:Amino acid/amide ABC transporter ATP-binding protein 2, HAAT family n=1 Tax=Muricoccus roseus TaxID=198092 RepID=A0A1M6FKS0_9PROT|nr:ABC transporter ATP-binding protein [Roseomonas rosea]SHI98232.1 amino acid/amide ABC transporter ATP-binding protein 2, HAAT family [Roseomonas rosea]
MALLEVSGLSVSYGRVAALNDVSLTVREGEIVTVLGANGAGKSTLLRAILGAVPAKAGGVTFAGEDVSREPPHARIARGLCLVPEGRRILISLSVEENLLLGAHMRRDTEAVRREMDAIYGRFPNLAERRKMLASCLSGGEQQMLAIGRAMMARPRLMMLDEPSLGLSPLFVSKLFALIRELNAEGLSVLLVEQNTTKALAVAHGATVLELGRVIMAGDPKALAADPRLQEAYLGEGAAAPAPY